MSQDSQELTVRVVSRLAEVSATDWDACAGEDNPFLSHAFLEALEASGSTTRETGWLPQHLLLEDGGGKLLGAVPLYLKGHSYSEYVFDHGWADAYERAGGRYYPKLQSAVPFTPVTGRRLLLHPNAPPEAAQILIDALVKIGQDNKLSSIHVTFPTREDCEKFTAAGFLQRVGRQFHWENEGYRTFDDFLEALASRKRKQIRRERRDAVESGLKLEAVTGSALEPRHWDAFFRFYMSTSDRKWGSAYLTREFFDLIGQRMPEKIVLMMAEKDGRYVAGALNLRGTETLFGRNWGCLGDFPFLHFELCYYQAIDFAIAHGLKRVEAGAQGEHKIQRGYLPSETYSAHWIRDPGFASAVADFLTRERRAIDRDIEHLTEFSPFKRTSD